MKIIALFSLLLALTACQAQTPVQLEASYKPIYERHMSDIDDEKYSATDPELEASRTQFCQSPTIQNCLSATSSECIKIHRKETHLCQEKIKASYGEAATENSGFSSSYVNGCALGGMIKYGKQGPQSTMQCMKIN